MKKASLIAAVLLLQFSYLPLVAQASPEEKAVGKAAIFYRHLNIARGISSPGQTAATPKKPSGQIEVIPPSQIPPSQIQPEPVKAEPAAINLVK
jgi:hypothetical protein